MTSPLLVSPLLLQRAGRTASPPAFIPGKIAGQPSLSGPQFRAASAVEGADATLVIPTPAYQTGDLMLAFQGSDDEKGTGVSGTWNLLYDGGAQPTYARVYSRVATASEPTSYTFSYVGFVDICAAILTISSYNGSQPVLTGLTDASGNGTTLTAPSVTGIKDGLLVNAYWVRSDQTTTRAITTQGGVTKRADTMGSWSSLGVTTETLGADGPTGVRTASFSLTNPWYAVSLVVRPDDGYVPPVVYNPSQFMPFFG